VVCEQEQRPLAEPYRGNVRAERLSSPRYLCAELIPVEAEVGFDIGRSNVKIDKASFLP
jgi:hypothetical protein